MTARRAARVCAAVLTAALMAACDTTTASADQASIDVCGDWRDLQNDRDLVTNAEVRDRVQTMHDRNADDRDVAAAARSMLAASTADDPAAFGQAGDALTAACVDLARQAR